MKDPVINYHYFDFFGRAEPGRIMMTMGGIKFNDVRISLSAWGRLKPTHPYNGGSMPLLELDGKVMK